MKNQQSDMPYISAVTNYIRRNSTLFHMPGHNMGKGIYPLLKKTWGKRIFQYDLSEADGLDNVNVPTGVIKVAEDLAAEAFGSRKTFFLVNGSTLGNQAAILASVRQGEKILIARDAHESAYTGLLLSGAVPVYVFPTLHKQSGFYPVIGSSHIAKVLKQNPDTKAVHITTPSPIGFQSDVMEIAKVVHAKHIPLLVDEAHGSHFAFHPELPDSAVNSADIILHSSHKTIGSLTQSAMLHLGRSSNISASSMQSYIQLLQSSSPSTLLVMSLEAARAQMATHGFELLAYTLQLARFARNEINKTQTYYCYGREVIGTDNIFNLDETKLLIDISKSGYSGYEVEKLLVENYGIEIEMSGIKHILCFITIGNTNNDIKKLLRALRQIMNKPGKQSQVVYEVPLLPQVPEVINTPREAFFADKYSIPLKESAGKTAAEFVVPFPPDMPLLVPGEMISEEIVDYLIKMRKSKFVTVGMHDSSLNTILVVK